MAIDLSQKIADYLSSLRNEIVLFFLIDADVKLNTKWFTFAVKKLSMLLPGKNGRMYPKWLIDSD